MDPDKSTRGSRSAKVAVIIVLSAFALVLLTSRVPAVRVRYHMWRIGNELGPAQEPSIKALAALGSHAVPALRAALSAEREATCSAAARALAGIDAPEAVDALIDALGDPAMRVRLTAIRILGERDDPRARRALAALLGDPAGEIRIRTLLALLGTGDPDMLPHLRRALKDRRADVRTMAILAISRFPSEVAIPELLDALKTADKPVLQEAVSRLGDHDPAAVLDALALKLRTDPALAPGGRALIEYLAEEDPGEDAPAMIRWWEANRGRLTRHAEPN